MNTFLIRKKINNFVEKQSKRYLSAIKNPPKGVTILRGKRGAPYFIDQPRKRKKGPKVTIGKITLPDGKIRYLYPKGKSPQSKYYYSDRGQQKQREWSRSEKRIKYLREYYGKNRDKMIERAMKRHRRLKAEKELKNNIEKQEDPRQAKQLSDLRDMRAASRIQMPQIKPIKRTKK